MRFIADLHIHSKYSRACSKDCDLEHLTWWARRKGITLVGTGDFTHPAWLDHLRENLVPAEPGLFRLREDVDADIRRRLPPSCAAAEVRFLLSVEIATIYKRAERTRKVHHLVYMPDFAAAEEFNRRLGRIGNLGSDGRPILGLDSRDLLEIALESGPGSYLVPAHVWTPWFAVLGSKSGFDAIEDCYADLADHIFALETGLSSDPEMNWRISGLDSYRPVSNSDAPSPPMLGREATLFDPDLASFATRKSLETGVGHAGSLEFFPEEGKYHVDGHRKCGVRMEPAETREHGGLCPGCGKPLTIGVLSRVEDLADRPEAIRPPGAADFRSLVPLPEIMSEILGVGPKSKKVLGEIDRLTATFGPELTILQDVPVDDLSVRSSLLGEAIARLRRGEVIRDAGYDGEYGVIRLFEPGEVKRGATFAAPALFDDGFFAREPKKPAPAKPRPKATPAVEEGGARPSSPVVHTGPLPGSLLNGLDQDQRVAAASPGGPLLIIAGPGTGKTRTVTHRIAHLVIERGVPAEQCLAITFTRRAAEEMADRLAVLAGEHAPGLTIATFHALGVRILREHHDRAGLRPDFAIADRAQQLALAAEFGGEEDYRAALRERNLVDFDELIELPLRLLESDDELTETYRDRYRWISVDEYQDVDERQYRLLRRLCPLAGNLTAIGDPDQAIYSFRGADVGFFLRFRQDFPQARAVTLTRNYRSNPHILRTALQAIAPATLVRDRELRPMGEHGDALVGMHQAIDERAEAAFVARSIDQLLGGASFHSLDSGRASGNGQPADDIFGFSDFAVLYRTDRQARAVMDALTHAGLPFQKRSHDRLADRPGVDRVLGEIAFAGPGSSVVDRVRRAADAVVAREPEESAVHAAVEVLRPLAERCGDDLERFRTELSLGVEVDTWDPRADRVSLLTLHASKGLEFPVVFVVGCEDGLLPLRWPGEDGTEDQLNEERRLLFVGMTRAQRRLYLSHAAERSRQGAGRTAGRSPFLADIADGFERIGDSVRRARPRQTQLRLL